MASPVILVVEDNPLTRNVLREILLGGGFEVLEAPDGRTALSLASERRPDLVLQDMALPDMEGTELLRWLRAQVGPAVPILALSGLPAEIRRAQGDAGVGPGEGFTECLVKPLGAPALLRAVRRHLAAGERAEAPPAAAGARVLVVEGGEPLESLVLELGRAGFEVASAAGADAALAEARRRPPAVVVSGVLLPDGDGFRLCHTLRRDPALAGIPVVLVSAFFDGEEDRALARKAGASDLVAPGDGGGGPAAAVGAALAGKPPAPRATKKDLSTVLAERVAAALRREAARRGGLERRLGFQAAALALLGVMAESLSRPREVARAPDEVLARCLSAAGTSRGAAFLRTRGGRLALSAQVGFGEGDSEALRGFFGHADLLERALGEREPLVLPSPAVPAGDSADLLKRARARSALVAPLFLGRDQVGVMAMFSVRFDLTDWADLARAVSFEVSQALALGRAVGALAASESRYRTVFESAAWGIYRSNRAGAIAEANPALAAILGVPSPEDIVGTDPARYCRRPGDRARMEERLRAGQRFHGLEVEWSRADGKPVQVLLSGRPHRGEDGEPDGFSVFVEDAGGRRDLEERLRAADRLGAMQTLAGGIVHDLNNLLTAIAGRAELLARSLEHEAADLHGHAVEIQKAVDRAGSVARELQAFGRRIPEPREVDVNAILDGALPMVRQIAGEGITVLVRRGDRPGRVFADPGDLEQALVSLAARAREAMPRGGTLTLETAAALLDGDFAQRHPGAAPGSYAVVSVADTGPLLDEQGRERVFEPLSAGGGLGLASVRDLARRLGGFALALPGAERGNSLRVYLPRREEREEAPAPEPVEPRPTPGRGAGEVVLLAEDEPAVRSLIAETLRLEGYSVVEARDGDEALRAAEEVEGAIDLLVSDLMMPRLGGRELAQRLRRRRPGLRLLFVTGYLDRPADAGDARILQKPFTPTQLAAKVREALAAPPEGAP